MPHVVVKLLPGRTEQQKMDLARQIVKDVVRIACTEEANVSVALEKVSLEEWAAKVYETDIKPNRDRLYVKPGYNPYD